MVILRILKRVREWGLPLEGISGAWPSLMPDTKDQQDVMVEKAGLGCKASFAAHGPVSRARYLLKIECVHFTVALYTESTARRGKAKIEEQNTPRFWSRPARIRPIDHGPSSRNTSIYHPNGISQSDECRQRSRRGNRNQSPEVRQSFRKDGFAAGKLSEQRRS